MKRDKLGGSPFKLLKLHVVPYTTELQRKYNDKFHSRPLELDTDIDLNGALFCVCLYKKLVERDYFSKLEAEINDEAYYEFLNNKVDLIPGEIYFGDGSLNEEMVDFISYELLENLEDFGFEKEMEEQILKWNEDPFLYSYVDDLVRCSLSLVVI